MHVGLFLRAIVILGHDIPVYSGREMCIAMSNAFSISFGSDARADDVSKR